MPGKDAEAWGCEFVGVRRANAALSRANWSQSQLSDKQPTEEARGAEDQDQEREQDQDQDQDQDHKQGGGLDADRIHAYEFTF